MPARLTAQGVFSRVRTPLVALAAVLASLAALITARVALRWGQLARDGLRLAYAAVTLRAYRRCPECRHWLRGDAGVCWRCGARRRGRRWGRAGRRF